MADRIWIADPRRAGAALRGLGGRTFSWTYLGPDAGRLSFLEARMGGRGVERPANRALQRIARERQSAFVDYAAALSVPSPESWADPLLEKNPEVSRFYYNVCGVLAARELAAGPGDWVLFADSPALRRTLSAMLPAGAARLDARWFGRMKDFTAKLLRAAGHRALFFAAAARAAWQARIAVRLQDNAVLRRAFPSDQDWTVIFTWVHDRSFVGGAFRDFFFADLAEKLKAAGQSVLIAPRIMPGTDRRRILGLMKVSGTGFLDMYLHLPLRRVARRLWDSVGDLFRVRAAAPPFAGVDARRLAAEDAFDTRIYPRVAEALLYEDLVAAWARAGLRIGRFIYPYENHGWERVLLGALRRHYPGAVTVGYLHSRLPDLIPNYHRSPGESAPQPDVLIANGPASHRRLLETGHEAGRVLCRGTLRYRYLLSASPAPARAPGAAGRALVAFPIGLDESRELFWRVREAFADAASFRVVLKFHPDAPAGRVLRGLADREMPAHFETSEEPMDQTVRKADFMIYTTSTSSLEAAAAGLRTIHYVVACNLDGDPLGDAPDVRRDVHTSMEMREAAEALAREGFPRLPAARAAALVRENFGAPEDDIYPLFLSPRPVLAGAAR